MRRSSDVTDSRYVPNPETILNKLRVFCGKYFFETDIEKKKRYQTVLIEYLKPRIIKLCDKLNTQVLDVEPSLIQVKSPIFVFGDIRCTWKCLRPILLRTAHVGIRTAQEADQVRLPR